MKFRVLFVPVLIAFMVTGITTESLSQLSVNTGTAISLTPQQFVQTYLVGTGVTISNALYNGSSEPLNSSLRTPPKYRDQIGSFTTTGGAQTELGISGGVIMSSGYVAKAIAPNNPSDDMEGTNSPFESDPDLYILANKEINDKSVLEFDFVPETDVITFRYVFSSLEFDNYCGSNYNDAFGLFLSGPGIAGGQGFTNNAVNIAVLPETIAYVTIANVCAADNGNTGKGTYSWWNAAKTYFSYNRLTYVLTASYPVTCNQTYHMKFAIGDAYDGILDSGVFLEQNSFSSNSVMGSTSLSNPLTGQYLVEGCGTATLIYSVAQTHPTNLTIYLSIDPLGTANQADILPNPFPTEIVLPAYSIQTAPILIQAVSDGLTEPVETLIIDATTTTCNVTNTETTEMTIKDVTPMVISAVNKTICDGTPAVLTAVVTGGQPILPASTFNYLWNTTATTQSITVSPPLGHTVYSVTATDACGQAGSTATYVDSGIIPASTSPITGINTVCTPVTGVTYSIPPMTGADSYIWTVPAGAAITSGGSTNTITVDFSISSVSGVITVKGTNSICGPGQPVSLAINVAPNPQAAGSITGLATICTPASGVSYSVPAITGATSYLWTLPAGASVASGNNTNSIIVDFSLLAVSGNVTVLGQSTLCGSGQPSSVALNVHPIPQPAGPITGPATICTPASAGVYSTLPMTGADSYSWTLPAGAAIISGGTTNTISVNFNIAAIPGTISVVGTNNTCGSGQPATLALNIAPSPQAAGPITGLTNICTPASGIAYSVPAITGANSYLWTVPAGASVISGGNTNSITADFDNSAATGPITVSAQSTLCGNGQPSALVLNIHPLPQPAGAITGITTICTPLTSVNYSISAVTGANSYIWTLPSGVTVTGGNNTSAITVDFSQAAASGTISVKAHSNFCGDGTPSSMALTIHPSPEPAGQITGASPVCQGNAIITYSISPLAYTTSYDWSVPPGVSVVGGAGTNMISCLVTTSAVSGNFSVRGHNAECSFGQPALKSVIINPLPGAAGSITSPSGAIVCQGSTGNPYTVVPIQDATSYFWEYSGTGYTFTNNGSNLLIDFSSSATPGNLKVTGSNSCGDGTVSPLFPVTVNPKPVTDFVVCNDLKTTKNGRPILLKGGYPLGTGGAYSGTGVTQVSPGNYVFDPSNSSVSAGGTVNPVNYTITFRYTNIYNCSDEKSKVVAVFASNGNDPCPGTVKDYRDDKSYPTFLTGAGINTRCWTASNLNYGNYTDQALTQTDNCIFEKYCRNNLATQCDLYGGYYQWGELMHYQETPVFQDICPPGWHVATSAEWDNLITTNLGNGIAGSALKDTMNVNSFKGLLKGVLYLNHSWAFGSGTNSGSIYWTSDAGSPETAASRGLNSFNLSVSLYQSSRANAFPVRCVRN